MNKFLKIFLVSIIALFIGAIIYLNYETHFSKAAKEGKANIENIKKVKKGMNEKTVIKIMGEPDYMDYCDVFKTLKGYNYHTNDKSWMYVTVCFDSIMTVQKTYYPKKN